MTQVKGYTANRSNCLDAAIKWYEVYPQGLPSVPEISTTGSRVSTRHPGSRPGSYSSSLREDFTDRLHPGAITMSFGRLCYKDGDAMKEFAPFLREEAISYSVFGNWFRLAEASLGVFLGSPRDEAAAALAARLTREVTRAGNEGDKGEAHRNHTLSLFY